MTEALAEKICTPCRGGVPPLAREEVERYLSLVQGWELLDDGRLVRRTYRFKSFGEALTFVHGLGALAEAEGHHPVDSGARRNGLSEADLDVSAKLSEQRLERGEEAQALPGRQVVGEDDLLQLGVAQRVEVARQVAP